MWLLPIKVRLKGAILSSCHGEQEGPLTPCLPNYMCLSFLYPPPRPHFRSFSSAVLDMARNLYAAQEATVTTRHGTMDWFQIGKGVCQGCILPPYIFNLYAEYIMLNARLEESHAEIKFSGRNINNFRYADDTTLWHKLKRDERASWWRWKRGVKKKAGLKLNIQKTKIMASGP